jgi:hypothetical protein
MTPEFDSYSGCSSFAAGSHWAVNSEISQAERVFGGRRLGLASRDP